MALDFDARDPAADLPDASDDSRASARTLVARERLLPPPLGSPVWGWIGPVAVMLFAAVLRIHRLSIPGKMAFDEVYYACDAWSLLKHGYERTHDSVDCRTFLDGPAFIVHPPLGKWLIAIGEYFYGWGALGWRISAAVVGSLSVLVVARMGRRLFRSTLLGCLAGLLLALDGLHFVQSRTSMLDIFLMFFVVAGAACLLVDRDEARRRMAERLGDGPVSYPGPKLGFRWWRVFAGVCFGAALATKWSAIYYIAAFAVLALLWEVSMRRAAGVPAPFRAALWRGVDPALVCAVVLLPVLIYLLSWTGWFVTDGGWRRTCVPERPTNCGAIAGFVEYHQEMFDFHKELKTKHTYQSRPWGWLLLARPVAYYYTSPKPDTAKEVLAIGTPLIWWASIFALGATLVRWFSRRDWRAGLILVGFAAGYVPWFWPADRTEFLFYALPALPFMCLALAYCAGLVLGGPDASPLRRRNGTIAVAAYTLGVAANFFYFYPILAAKVIPYSHWQDRIWFGSWI